MDLLIQQTHVWKWNLEKNHRWMDNRVDEQDRNITIKTKPITLLLKNAKDKHYALTMLDTPGHPNFLGEIVSALRLCDGVILVVDAIEGVMLMTHRIIKHIVR
jgi:U5 small nuclear ribonucleoprotein component